MVTAHLMISDDLPISVSSWRVKLVAKVLTWKRNGLQLLACAFKWLLQTVWYCRPYNILSAFTLWIHTLYVHTYVHLRMQAHMHMHSFQLQPQYTHSPGKLTDGKQCVQY